MTRSDLLKIHSIYSSKLSHKSQIPNNSWNPPQKNKWLSSSIQNASYEVQHQISNTQSIFNNKTELQNLYLENWAKYCCPKFDCKDAILNQACGTINDKIDYELMQNYTPHQTRQAKS